jgi:hypothetical protein
MVNDPHKMFDNLLARRGPWLQSRQWVPRHESDVDREARERREYEAARAEAAKAAHRIHQAATKKSWWQKLKERFK